MADRGKVIKGLECCGGISSAYECPYQGSEGCDNCRGNIYLDALTLLKAQEQEISRLKHHVDCNAAEKLPSGCVGYGRGFNDDEPCETCKKCEKYNGYGEE